ncbi:MAG: hypothetical protein ACSHX4_13570 [Opitutaceae bacterium]
MHRKLSILSFSLLVWILASLPTLGAQVTSPELERLQAQMEPYVLPVELGSKIIPSIKFDKTPIPAFIETMQGHGVEVVASKSVQDSHLNISLRNLSLNQILTYATNQIGAHWIYQDGRVVIFQSPSELNPSYQKVFERKFAIDQQIRTETRRLRDLETKRKKEILDNAFITEFSVDEATLTKIIEMLSEATVTEGLDNGKGLNLVPLFNPKSYPEKRSYSFRNRSFTQILDSICEDYQMEWKAGQDAITIKPKRQ